MKTSPSGNVALAPAFDDRDALDRKLQLRVGRNDPHAIGLAHPLGERLLSLLHRHVIGRADVEIKILERRRAHVGRLGERIGRIPQHDPLRLGDANVGVNRLPPMLLVQVHLLVRHIGKLAAVRRPANADVGLHLLHPGRFNLAGQLHALHGRRLIKRPQHRIRLPRHQRHGPALAAPSISRQTSVASGKSNASMSTFSPRFDACNYGRAANRQVDRYENRAWQKNPMVRNQRH